MNRTGLALAVIGIAVALLPVVLHAADEPAIDQVRAKQLWERWKRGDKLLPEEQAYLDRARAERAGASKSAAKPAAENQQGLAGDNGETKGTVAGIKIAPDLAPTLTITAVAEDGRDVRAFYRRPPGDEKMPAVICLHGGASSVSDGTLQELLARNPTYTRLLARGYVVVAGDYRTYEATPKSRGPVHDCLALVDAVKKLPFVDPESVVVFGGSGGGSLALDIAASTKVAAIVCGEPATLLFCGMLGDGEFGRRMAVLQDPQQHYTAAVKAYTQEKIKRIACPVLILHGDVHSLKKLNEEIFVPELEAASVDVVYKVYPGNNHGFYWGGGRTTEKTVEQFMNDVDAFLADKLKTQPKLMTF